MNIINLNNNPFHDLKIVHTERIKSKNGKFYTRIDYLPKAKKDDLLIKITSAAWFTVLDVGSSGIFSLGTNLSSCIVEKERKKECQIYTVYSETSLLDHLLNRIKQSSSANALLEEALAAQKNNALTYKLMPPGDLKLSTGEAWYADYYPEKSRIRISLGDKEDRLLSYLIFELCNAKQAKLINSLEKEVRNGSISSADGLARKAEELEYDTIRLHTRVIQQAIKKDRWSPSILLYKKIPATFEEHWETMKSTPHADSYRTQFKEIVSQAEALH